MAESPDFDAWYASMVGPGVGEGLSAAETRTRQAFLRRWFSAFYERHGSTARDVVEAAFVLDQLKLAAENVSTVMRDFERTTDMCPTVVVDDYVHSVRISVDGSYTTPSVEAWENPEALAEVAGYLQEHVWDGGIWPLCPQHRQVLLPEVEGPEATWWCRTGDHRVCRIGDLGQPTE